MNTSRLVESTFIETARVRKLMPPDSRITAAVSGGSDSVALLRLMHAFCRYMRWNVDVLHIDHGLRDGSGRDAEFVRTLSSDLGFDFQLKIISPPDAGSLEGYFSAERQRIFREAAEDGSLVATGHTADDRAETLIMRLLEGAGLRGLGGMDYRGRDSVVRPLLDLTRNQLREYLVSMGQDWVEDPTNREDVYLRNRIRHRIMPVLEEISPGCSLALARSSANLSQWRDIFDEMMDESLDGLLNGDTFHRESYLRLPKGLRTGILWLLCGRPRGGRMEIEKTDRWIRTGKDGFHDLPGGNRIELTGDTVRVMRDGGKE